ncbi:MAG: CCA tRNA nucleotidyltransferase [Thermoplasmataceae archaeon]
MIDIREILLPNIPDDNEREEISEITEILISGIRQILSRDGIEATPVLVGSTAKHTNLKNADIDIFMVFDRKYTERQMESIGLRIGHEVLPDGMERYAEHPYVSGHIKGRKIDIVPCFKIEKNTKIISSVDRTPLHTEYVLSHLDEKRRNDVLALKLFMKSIGVYGSEIRVQGFSGYVCELLVINFGSFQKVLEKFSSQKGRLIIPESTALAAKYNSPVIIEDPTDSSRNAAAAISLENFSIMKIESRLFLHSPSQSFFTKPQHEKPLPYVERGTCTRIIILPKPDLVDDVIYSQAQRAKKILVEHIVNMGFHYIDSDLYVGDRIEIMIETEAAQLPAVTKHIGPPVDTPNSMAFIMKWRDGKSIRGPYVCDDRICVDAPSGVRDIDTAISSALSGSNIGKNLDKVKGEARIIDPSGSNKAYMVLGKFYSRKIRL